MSNTAPIDKNERDHWLTVSKRNIRRWLIWTATLLITAYFLPLRWAVLLALFYARLADPEFATHFGNLPFVDPIRHFYFTRFLLQQDTTLYATSMVLRDKISGDTRARLHTLDNGEPALSLYSENGDETAVFTTRPEIHEVQKLEEMGDERRTLEGRPAGVETEMGETLRELQFRIKELERERERESDERNEKISSHSFELLDKEGRKRAELEADDQPRLSLYDEKGVRRASLSLNEGGYPVLQLTNLDWNRISSIGEDGSSRGRIRIGFDDDGHPELLMHDAEVGGLDPALVLAVRKAEWVGVGEVGVGDTRYRSKTAFLACDAWLGGKHEGKFFGARVVEPVTAESA
jgi:hypothetical protein